MYRHKLLCLSAANRGIAVYSSKRLHEEPICLHPCRPGDNVGYISLVLLFLLLHPDGTLFSAKTFIILQSVPSCAATEEVFVCVRFLFIGDYEDSLSAVENGNKTINRPTPMHRPSQRRPPLHPSQAS